MADRVFCIDFGSAYTKVALRRDPGAEAELITWPNIDFCVPTAVVVDRRRSKPSLTFGDEAADQKPGGGIDVHRNWKKSVFAPLAATKAGRSPLEALLDSDELAQLATKYGVASGQIDYLRQMVGAARGLISGPGGRVVSSESQQQAQAGAIAAHFFHWLRGRVLEACARLPVTGLKFEDIPVRVTVPALEPGADFAAQPGCGILREAMHRAGWPLHDRSPFTPEPYANAIGILTGGTNVLKRGSINLGEMFGKGPLVTVLKDRQHYPSYRALVIDVGAFTTDFAAVDITPNDDTTSDPDRGFTVVQRSVPVGVSDLDARVLAALPKEKADWLANAKWQEFATFQRNAYSDGKGYRVAGLGVIGGDVDRATIQSCLGEFVQKLADEVSAFTASSEPAKVQELILTGGGSHFPAVREALLAAAQTGGNEYVKTHAPDLKRAKPGGPPVDRLDEQFARGGSALGGASIYFEREYY